MRTRWIRPILVLVAVLLLPAAVLAQTAPTEATQPGAPTTLQMQAAPAANGWLRVEARLTGADGRPQGMQDITFWLNANFFGDRPVKLGHAATDANGVATLQYQPSWDGEQRLEADFAGGAGLAPAAAKHTLALTGTMRPHFGQEPSLLRPVWRLIAAAAGVVTFALWFTFIGTVVWVSAGINGGRLLPQYRAVATMDATNVKGD